MTSGGTLFCLVIFMAAGIFAGTVFSVLYLFVKITKNNFIVIFAVDFFATIFAGLVFNIISFKYFYASITFYFIVCFVAGIVFESVFIKNLVANPLKNVYNKIRKRKQSKER